MTGLRANSKIIGSFRKLEKIGHFVQREKRRENDDLFSNFFEKC